MSVSRQSSTISSTSVPTVWMSAWIALAKLLLRASETVSTSLVKRLITSPWRVESKYESGRRSRWSKRSRRMSSTTFWAARTMICV